METIPSLVTKGYAWIPWKSISQSSTRIELEANISGFVSSKKITANPIVNATHERMEN